MSKLTMLVSGGVGYVLGARAGRERYEQIRRTALRVKGNPAVQSTAHKAADAAAAAAPVVKDKVADAATAAVHMVKPGSSNGVPMEDGAYPKG